MLTLPELKQAQAVLDAPLGAGLAPAKVLQIVEAAIYYAERAALYERRLARDRVAAASYRARQRQRRRSVSREMGRS